VLTEKRSPPPPWLVAPVPDSAGHRPEGDPGTKRVYRAAVNTFSMWILPEENASSVLGTVQHRQPPPRVLISSNMKKKCFQALALLTCSISS